MEQKQKQWRLGKKPKEVTYTWQGIKEGMGPGEFHYVQMSITLLTGVCHKRAAWWRRGRIGSTRDSTHSPTRVSSRRTPTKMTNPGIRSGPDIDRCVPFQIMSNRFTTGRFQWSCGNISKVINGNWMHLRSILCLIAKGLNTSLHKVFLFIIFYKLATISKTLFSLCHYGVLYADWWYFFKHLIDFRTRL